MDSVSSPSPSPLVPCSKEDFLSVDQSLRGQNYALVSFLSPEEVLRSKDIFMFGEFMKTYGTSMKQLMDGLRSKYPSDEDAFNVIEENYRYLYDIDRLQDEYRSFCKSNEPLEDAFYKQNSFRSTIRGIKIRGCFDTIDEAKHRSDILKASDPNFNIYVAEVGTWVPWDPNPDKIGNAEYAETELNTLMKKYHENLHSKDELYLARKEELRVAAMKKNPSDEPSTESVNNDTVSDGNVECEETTNPEDIKTSKSDTTITGITEDNVDSNDKVEVKEEKVVS